MLRIFATYFITLVVFLISGCVSKYPVLSSYSLHYKSVPNHEENATLFKVQKPLKISYHLLKESLKSLEYDIEKKVKFCHLDASKATVTIYTISSSRGSSSIAGFYLRSIYSSEVWLSAISDQETQICVQVIVNEAKIKDSKIQKNSEKIYRSESSEKKIILEFIKHFSGYFTKLSHKTNKNNISSSISGVKLIEAEPVYSYLMHLRNGWMFGLSAGYGLGKSVDPNGNIVIDRASNAAGIRFGKMINPHILINAEWDGWIFTDEESPLTAKYSLLNYTLACTYYPGDPKTSIGGIYLRSGIGFALTSIKTSNDYDSIETNESGFGFLIGAGYEQRISRKFALGVGFCYNKLIINGDNYFKSGQFIPILVDLNYYF